ncbi:MAG TPA: DUF998 domain-containing protein [Burkholderiales bacterium]|jgi:hypothetical protein
MRRTLLLVCGILAPVLYVSTDMLAAIRWEGYSYTAQTISETFAIGAPTRPLVLLRGLAYSVLVIAFGLGVWGSAGGKRPLRVAGGLLVGVAIVDLVAPFLAPMHLRGAERTLADTMHIVLASVDVLFILLIIGFGTSTFGKWFRLYSVGTILVVVAFGTLAGLDGPRIAANLPTPWVGVTERISVFSYMLWLVVFAIGLLRAQSQLLETGLGGRGK